MSRKISRSRSSRSLLAALIFVLIVVFGGIALQSSGNLNNPFTVFSDITSMVSGTSAGGQFGGEGGSRPARPEGAAAPSGEARGGEGGEGGQTSIQWDQIGGVLFNLWFIAAASAFIMIIGRPIGYLLNGLRNRSKRKPVPVLA